MTVAPLVAADGADHRAVGMRTGELFATHARMVFAICRSILRDPSEAEDATQAAFLSAHEALAGGSVIRDPGAWLATIARNECRARLRNRSSEPLELYAEVLAHAVTTDDAAERRATAARLRSEIAALPDRQREAVVLRDLYGLSYGEVGVALGVSRPSVEALLFRARRTLRVRLRPLGGTAIAVPVAVREGLAQAVPWFAQGQAAGISAAAGAGVLGQLAWPTAAKVAAGVVALGAAGHAVVDREVPVPPREVQSAQVAPHNTSPSAGSQRERAGPVRAAPAPGTLDRPAHAPAAGPDASGTTTAPSATRQAPTAPADRNARRASETPASGRTALAGPVARPAALRAGVASTAVRAPDPRPPVTDPTRTRDTKPTSAVTGDADPARELTGDRPTRTIDLGTTTVNVSETGARVPDGSPPPPAPTR